MLYPPVKPQQFTEWTQPWQPASGPGTAASAAPEAAEAHPPEGGEAAALGAPKAAASEDRHGLGATNFKRFPRYPKMIQDVLYDTISIIIL